MSCMNAPFNFIVVNDKFFLQDLDGVQAARFFLFCQHDLTKITLSEYRQEVEVVQPDFPLALPRKLLLLHLHLLLLLLHRRK